jgi:hypothetical protein
MLSLPDTKFFNKWRGRSSTSGGEPAIDTSALLGGVNTSYMRIIRGSRRGLR